MQNHRGYQIGSRSCATPNAAGGFLPHADVLTNAHGRRLERLCRYISRPAVSEKRLPLTASGALRCRRFSQASDTVATFGRRGFARECCFSQGRNTWMRGDCPFPPEKAKQPRIRCRHTNFRTDTVSCRSKLRSEPSSSDRNWPTIGVGKDSRPPRPPNCACGSPAHSSPVGSFLIGIGSPEHGLRAR